MISVIEGSGIGSGVVDGLCGGVLTAGGGGGIISFSWIIRPPLLDVFSTCKAIEIPCSFFPKPCPS